MPIAHDRLSSSSAGMCSKVRHSNSNCCSAILHEERASVVIVALLGVHSARNSGAPPSLRSFCHPQFGPIHASSRASRSRAVSDAHVSVIRCGADIIAVHHTMMSITRLQPVSRMTRWVHERRTDRCSPARLASPAADRIWRQGRAATCYLRAARWWFPQADWHV